MVQEESYRTPQQAADYLGVSRLELQAFTNNGDIEAVLRMGSEGPNARRSRRYSLESLREFASQHPDLIGTEKPPQIQTPENDDISDTDVRSLSDTYEVSTEDEESIGAAGDEDVQERLEEDTETFADEDETPPADPTGIIDPETVSADEREVESTSLAFETPEEGQVLESDDLDDRYRSRREQAEGISHFIWGLGSTGAQIIDQARRSDYHADRKGSDTLETPYRFFLMDTSVDVNPDRSFYKSNTRQGLGRWFKQSDIIILSNLASGAGRLPVVSEFIAEHALVPKLSETGETASRLSGINASYLIHSVGGGTGCGLAPWIARWLRNTGQGGSRIGITLLGNAQGIFSPAEESDNSLYAFPKVNEEMDLIVLIDNSTVAGRYNQDDRTRMETRRYLDEFKHVIFTSDSPVDGMPDYLEESDQLYSASDRYAYRIMSSLNRLPQDIANVITFLKGNDKFAKGARWVLPYLYPLNADYEFDCRDVPPALMVLRALEKGGLCNPATMRRNSHAVVICEYPTDYPDEFVINLPQQAQKVVSDLLQIDRANVMVSTFRSPGKGFAATVLVAGTEPAIFSQWLSSCQDSEKHEEIRARWRQRISVADSKNEAATGDPWALICRMTSEAVKSTADERETFFKEISASSVEWRERTANYDICEDFLEFAEKIGSRNLPRG
ncbi:hypothetical protein M1N56_06230 [Dehalococcoidia bacterium]|nr:hypothetical protein [Dehalococcoidia bacterium]